MSTGLNCEFIEAPGFGHYYILEHGDAPKICQDWHEHADIFGPFPSEDAAFGHLAKHHANPGGAEVTGVIDPTEEKWAKLLSLARLS